MKDKLTQAFQEFYVSIIDYAPHLIVGLLILTAFILTGSFLRRQIRVRLISKVEDKMVVNAIGRVVYLVMSVIGVMLFLREVGWGDVASGLLAGAGVSAIIVGFAFKDIGENLLAGLFLAFSRPFRIGDLIEVNDFKGNVQSMQFRNTHIRTFDGRDIYMPNAMLIKNPLINYTRDGLLRHDFLIGLDYGNDILKAINIILEIAKKHEHLANGPGLTPFVMIDEYSTSTVNLKIYYWINHHDTQVSIPELMNNLMNAIVSKLSEEGFSMPADILELKIYQEDRPIPLNIQRS